MSRANWRAGLALLVIAAATVWSAFLFVGDNRLGVYFFDVGHGDAILIHRGAFQALIDGGPDAKILGHLGRAIPPWDRTIELVILTHPHADHVSGLLEVVRQYDIGQIWGTGVIHPTQVYMSLMSEIQNRQIPFVAVQAGQKQSFGGATISVLFPFKTLVGQKLDNANASSIVVKLTNGKFSALLTGDLEEDGQSQLVGSNVDLAATVLKIPHQGSRDADLPQFLHKVAAPLAILSVEQKNRYGHPHAEVIRRYSAMGIEILRTDRHGTIHLVVRDGTLWIKTEKTGTIARVELIDNK